MGRLVMGRYGAGFFMDRGEAGRFLAEELLLYKGEHPVVVGIPRGGVVLAAEIARLLEAEFDILLSHKLGAPGDPECAIGAVNESGKVFLNRTARRAADEAHLSAEVARCHAELLERARCYREVLPAVPLRGRTVILVDDGVAMGSTMEVALCAALEEKPSRLIVAVPVGMERAVKRLADAADETVCLFAPPFFLSVSQFYREFLPVEDGEVVNLLRHERRRSARRAGLRDPSSV